MNLTEQIATQQKLVTETEKTLLRTNISSPTVRKRLEGLLVDRKSALVSLEARADSARGLAKARESVEEVTAPKNPYENVKRGSMSPEQKAQTVQKIGMSEYMKIPL